MFSKKVQLIPNAHQNHYLNAALTAAEVAYNVGLDHFLKTKITDPIKIWNYVQTVCYYAPMYSWIKDVHSNLLYNSILNLDADLKQNTAVTKQYNQPNRKLVLFQTEQNSVRPVSVIIDGISHVAVPWVLSRSETELLDRECQKTLIQEGSNFFIQFDSDKDLSRCKQGSVGLYVSHEDPFTIYLSDGSIISLYKCLELDSYFLKRRETPFNREKFLLYLDDSLNYWYYRTAADLANKFHTIIAQQLPVVYNIPNTRSTNPFYPNITSFANERLQVSNWTEFYKILGHVCMEQHPQSTPTSFKLITEDKMLPFICSSCGHINRDPHVETEWVCPVCGARHITGVNAAKNLLNKAINSNVF